MAILVLTVSYRVKIGPRDEKKFLTQLSIYGIFYYTCMKTYVRENFGNERFYPSTFLSLGRDELGRRASSKIVQAFKAVGLNLGIILFFAIFSLAFADTSNDKVFLEKIQFQEDEQKLLLTLPFTQAIEFITYKLDSPPSLIIDILGNNVFTKQISTYQVNRGGVGDVKVMHFGQSSPQNPIDLIIVEFRQPNLSYSVKEIKGGGLKLLVRKKGYRPSLKKPGPDNINIGSGVKRRGVVKKKTVSNTVSQIVQPIDYTPDVKERNVFVVEGTKTGWQIWFENTLVDYKPLQIAQEQVNLAQIRVRKERRNLFPLVKLEGSETKGTTGVGEEEYEERRYGVGVEQPITYGGELRYKLRRALVNLDIAKKEYNRIRADYLYRVKEAYFKLLSPKLDLVDYSRLLKKARKQNNLIRKQYNKGLVTKEEYLRMESILDEIYYQVRSIVEDLEVAKVNFKQVLNLDMDTDIEVKPKLELEKIFVDKKECLEVARRKRPELKINQLVVDFNQFNREIAKAKQKFRISLSGFVGRKGSDYTTEPLDMENEWRVGLKVSKPFGTSTATTSFTTQSAPPSLSQAGAEADIDRASFELSLIDKMDLLTEKKSAQIEYLKSINELSEIKDTIATDVKTAYANYKKALYQIRSAERQIESQAQRVSILRFRWKAGQANLSDVLQSELRLVNQRSSYNKGMISYYIALSNLAKACGVDSYIDLYQVGAIARLSVEDRDYLHKGPSFSSFTEQELGGSSEVELQGYIMALGQGKHTRFAIINLGRVDGAKKGMSFTVYRDGSRLGDIKVISLRKNSSSCLVDEDISAKIRLGDKVEVK